ncbi:MAG: DNA mismatch repair endonuclease MutL [Nanoarchaeota archaeon]|nr:DNA mismatch repair endonuclease MutL [Nanoarchaeota archaeon]
MSKIVLLPEDLINKIAAGEVIERPASVIKELVENSLDAGASKITVELEESGKKRIRITDNGEGMSPEDAEKSILRHATSKISSVEDLFSIKTLGFRGEALASIAAVSKLSIITKQKEMLEGCSLKIVGGNILDKNIIGAEQGTSIEVQDIFFNTPARKKFLKTDAVELKHCLEVVTHYALANPNVAFKFTHDHNILLHSPALQDARSTIASIYGIQTAKELLEVNYSDKNVVVQGFISKPYHVRNDKNQQVLFVNGRWIKNSDITNAVYEGYHSTLFVNKHPVLVLHLQLNPETIDVNVHPQKQEIKIEQKEQVAAAVASAVREALQSNKLMPTVDVNTEQQITFGTPIPRKETTTAVKYPFEPSAQTVFAVEETAAGYGGQESASAVAEQYQSTELMQEKLPPLKLLGQVHKTYFLAETEGGLFYIDQHAAHERVMYESLLNQFLYSKVEVQKLLQGEVLDVSVAEKISLEEKKDELKALGFELEYFGGNTFAVKTIPLVYGKVKIKELLHDLLSMLENKKSILEKKEEILTRMACRAAVMAGDLVTIPQMERILQELSKTELPYTCPHGRPTLMKVTVDELEKKFRRK